MSFLVMAFRYGNSNGAYLLVGLADDHDQAWDLAAGFKHGDGGKWGVQGLEYTGGDFVQCFYMPSSYLEDGPVFNAKMALAERLGFEVLREPGKALTANDIEMHKEIIHVLTGESPEKWRVRVADA